MLYALDTAYQMGETYTHFCVKHWSVFPETGNIVAIGFFGTVDGDGNFVRGTLRQHRVEVVDAAAAGHAETVAAGARVFAALQAENTEVAGAAVP